MNGSDADGGCPQKCVGEASGIRRCDCMGTAREGHITGVLIDGMIYTNYRHKSDRELGISTLYYIIRDNQLCPRVQVPEPCCTSRGGDVRTLLSCLAADWSYHYQCI